MREDRDQHHGEGREREERVQAWRIKTAISHFAALISPNIVAT
jgi:hypothetical protein